MPIMARGTVSRLYEKLKTAIDPVVMSEAKETRKIKDMLSEPKVKVRGIDTSKTFFISLKLNLRSKALGKSPCSTTNGI